MISIQLKRAVFYLAIVVVFVGSVIPDTDVLPDVFNIWDKLNHFAAFLVLALLMDVSYFNMKTLSKCITLLSYGFFIECIQSILPTRSFSIYDLLFDLIGILIYFYFLKRFNPYASCL